MFGSKNAFGSPLRALLGEIVSYRPDGSAHALPEGSALGGLLDCQAGAEAPMVARIVVLEIPSQVPGYGIVRSQDSTERSWFKVSRFCYMLMKYPCDRRGALDLSDLSDLYLPDSDHMLE